MSDDLLYQVISSSGALRTIGGGIFAAMTAAAGGLIGTCISVIRMNVNIGNLSKEITEQGDSIKKIQENFVTKELLEKDKEIFKLQINSINKRLDRVEIIYENKN